MKRVKIWSAHDDCSMINGATYVLKIELVIKKIRNF